LIFLLCANLRHVRGLIAYAYLLYANYVYVCSRGNAAAATAGKN
jgi:hypothetical protein